MNKSHVIAGEGRDLTAFAQAIQRCQEQGYLVVAGTMHVVLKGEYLHYICIMYKI